MDVFDSISMTRCDCFTILQAQRNRHIFIDYIGLLNLYNCTK